MEYRDLYQIHRWDDTTPINDAVTAPIVGATKMEHLETAVGALGVPLSREEVTALEGPYVAHPVVPCLGCSTGSDLPAASEAERNAGDDGHNGRESVQTANPCKQLPFSGPERGSQRVLVRKAGVSKKQGGCSETNETGGS